MPQVQSAIVQFAPGSTVPTATIGLAQSSQAPMIIGPGGDICVAAADNDGNNILNVFPARVWPPPTAGWSSARRFPTSPSTSAVRKAPRAASI